MGGSTDILDGPEIEVASAEPANPSLAICLVSGGMDSCVTAAIAHEENEGLAFLHVSYGQRTEKRERRSFEDLANHFHVRKQLNASIEYLKDIGGSSFTDERIKVAEANLGSREIPTTEPK